jgi:hypothetical protein
MKSIAVKDFRDYLRDRFIDAQTSPGARLAPTHLLTHEMGVEGDLREQLTPTTWARVRFAIPSAKVKSAELLFYVNSDPTTREKPMRLLVNGQRLSHRQKPERMLTGGWDRCRIPAKYLQDGVNEIILSHSGVLHIDPFPGGLEKLPESHSSRSFDAGATWHQAAHGSGADIAGEYLVRLRLKGYPSTGTLTSPVVDLADPEGKGAIAPHLQLKKVTLASQQQAPQGTSIQYEMRTGTSPSFSPLAWGPWQRRTSLAKPGRFVQWRAILGTKSADKTPVLKAVTLKADLKEDHAALARIQLLELDQPDFATSSYAFTYMGSHPRQERLVKQHRLDQVIAAGKTELEQLALLRDWVHSQWLGWQADKYPYCPPWDPLEILETTKGNWGFGMCTHYGAVFSGCAAALGFVSRSIVVDHHCLAEVWSEDLQKWILEDAGPSREYDATYEVDSVPLNALELHGYLVRGEQKKVMSNKLPQKTVEPMTDHIRTLIRFGIPLRNTHLIHPEPAELRHGNGQYHWNGYLWWSDDADPKYAEYSLQTSRPADFYWSVNQTRLYLQAGATSDELAVALDNTTPNFSHYLVQIDAGKWEEACESSLTWKLHPGENQLAVRSVNRFGRQGRISRARVGSED